MSESKQVIGIDFGTSNSYFCKFLTETDGHKTRTIDFGNDQIGSISSSILYRNNKLNLIGTLAEQEWGESTIKEKKTYKLRTHFKPDILFSNEAKDTAIDFLKTIVSQLQTKKLDFYPDQHQVIMGVPAQASNEYKNTLKNIAKDAGYGSIKLLPEPVGALIYHLWNKDLSARQTQGGILVVDFGGGTCDFTYMQHLEVKRAWGDMSLGGRLFDDLFYQWFLELNPEAEIIISNEGDEYYVHWILCKKVKEHFSNSMIFNRNESVKWKVGEIKHYGIFDNLTWNEFIKRSENYYPHNSFLNYLQETDQQSEFLNDNKQINLIKWFKESLISGLDENKIRPSDIERVILTGGSSQWPFVEDIIVESLHIGNDKFLMSDNPKAAIGEGLVMLPHLKYKLEITANNLRAQLPKVIDEDIENEINKYITDMMINVIKEINVELFENRVRPVINNFIETGGTIQSLQEKLENDIYGFEPILKKTLNEKIQFLERSLALSIHQTIQELFISNGITYTGNEVKSEQMEDDTFKDGLISRSSNLSNLDDSIVNIVGGFFLSISGTIITMLIGGSGIALISGPIGTIIGLVIAAGFAYLSIKYGKERAKEMIKTIKLHPKLVKAFLPKFVVNGIIRKGKKALEKELTVEFTKTMREPVSQMKSQLRNNIDREIDSLSVINQL